ncbi:glycosyltransferase family 4 protein [Candidatus Bathyarchaeota archaeon]|nr:glycosyltransferase family 4 protein [Candidatus Bathyarchaeota archaeon]
MKVALCTDFFFPRIGGVLSHVIGLASQLERSGHEVVIITKQTNNLKECDGFRNVKTVPSKYVKPLIPFPTILVPPNPYEIQEIIKREGFDIVHAHHAFTPTSLLSIAAAKRLGIPAVLTNHTTFLASSEGYLWEPTSYILFPLRRYIRKADRIIAVSKTAADFIGHFADKQRIVIIPNAVDTLRFNPAICNVKTRSRFPTLEGEPTILYVGRLVHRKGIHVLIKAMPQVIEVFPKASLIIVGKGYMQYFLRLLSKTLNLDEHIKFLNCIPDDDLPDLYKISDVFVLPSLYCESFGISLLEAMACRKPVAASKVGGYQKSFTMD